MDCPNNTVHHDDLDFVMFRFAIFSIVRFKENIELIRVLSAFIYLAISDAQKHDEYIKVTFFERKFSDSVKRKSNL